MTKEEILKAFTSTINSIDEAMNTCTKVREYIMLEGKRSAYDDAIRFLNDALVDEEDAAAVDKGSEKVVADSGDIDMVMNSAPTTPTGSSKTKKSK